MITWRQGLSPSLQHQSGRLLYVDSTAFVARKSGTATPHTARLRVGYPLRLQGKFAVRRQPSTSALPRSTDRAQGHICDDPGGPLSSAAPLHPPLLRTAQNRDQRHRPAKGPRGRGLQSHPRSTLWRLGQRPHGASQPAVPTGWDQGQNQRMSVAGSKGCPR